MREYSNSKGQTLIEVLVALAVAIVIISAVSTAVVSSLSNTQFSKDQGLANRYAQQGMEHVRTIRNQNWSDFATQFTPTESDPFENAKILCLNKELQFTSPDATTFMCGQNIDESFIRTVKVESNSCTCKSNKPKDINIRKVTVSVAWSDSKCVNITPTPTPRILKKCGESCTNNDQCSSTKCSEFKGRMQCTGCVSGLGVDTPTLTPTPTPPTCDTEDTAIPQDSTFCHKTELVTCMSDVSSIPTLFPAVSKLTATCNDNKIDLSWNPIAGATRYLLRVNNRDNDVLPLTPTPQFPPSNWNSGPTSVYEDNLPTTIESDGKVHYRKETNVATNYYWWIHASKTPPGSDTSDPNIQSSYAVGLVFTCPSLE